jgi:mono/diheme cytochrome c family protein
MSQLQRLIDYGVITGADSVSDFLPLEESQGERKPRNDYELTAQGYMLGNCAHCHNPRGFPSVTNPVLVDVLNFSPSPIGGIFEFPLDRTSPRITRGVGGVTSIPYITPSLVDYPVAADGAQDFYVPKHATDPIAQTEIGVQTIFAPWRSLIYRNVDTPFTYADDSALFPHMPMNTPGYDCRVPRILGDWMVSIPAQRKRHDSGEYIQPVVGLDIDVDTNAQPYVEVKPGEADYDKAVADAATRLGLYHDGSPLVAFGALSSGVVQYPPRYPYCPDQTDIVDHDVINHPDTVLAPADEDQYIGDRPLMPRDGVPDRAHWVVTDLTDAPGDWAPRRLDWADVLVDLKPLPPTADQAAILRAEVIDMLQSVTLDANLKKFISDNAEMPYGLWVAKDGCDFSGVPKAGSFRNDPRAPWIAEVEKQSHTQIPDDAPVYTQPPGAAVFNLICINCHGPQADSRGRQADILMTMTGGRTRVANLRDGLFGPSDNPGANRTTIFSEDVQNMHNARAPVPADDMAARYLAFMGLGGTTATIPPAILQIVGNTEVLGEKRAKWTLSANDGNMLSTANELCRSILSDAGAPLNFDVKLGWLNHDGPLIWTNGDAHLWQRLCTLNNPAPVRVIRANRDWDGSFTFNGYADLYNGIPNPLRSGGTVYPDSHAVGTEKGDVADQITADILPWCVGVEPSERSLADAYLNDPAHFLHGKPLPECPPGLLVPANRWTDTDHRKWAVRGAMNAGLVVFEYLDGIAKKTITVKPRYDQCNLLQAAQGQASCTVK